MTYEEIELKLQKILITRIGLDVTQNPELKKVKLLGDDIGLPARELVLILYDIEKEYSINISKEYVVNGGFDSYDHILNAIVNSIS